MQVTGDMEAAQKTCETWARTYPREIEPYGFLSGMIYPVQGRYDQALDGAKKSVQYDPDFVFGYNIVALTDIALGDLEQAKVALREADERKLKISDLLVDRYEIAFLEGDQAGMDRIVSQTPGQGTAANCRSL